MKTPPKIDAKTRKLALCVTGLKVRGLHKFFIVISERVKSIVEQLSEIKTSVDFRHSITGWFPNTPWTKKKNFLQKLRILY